MKSIVFAGSMLAAWPAFAQYSGYQSDPLSHALLKGLVGGIQGAILVVITVLIGRFRSKLRAKRRSDEASPNMANPDHSGQTGLGGWLILVAACFFFVIGFALYSLYLSSYTGHSPVYSDSSNRLGQQHEEAKAVTDPYQDVEAAMQRQDYATVLQLLRPLAERGDARAESGIGLMYDYDHGVPKDDAEAAQWYRKAGEQGYALAQASLGYAYANGQGVARDDVQAVKWFRKAADQGYANAQVILGYSYHNGQGVPKDDAEAVKWYRKAAEQGYALAQASLGYTYANGQGVARDDVQAAQWYRKAADQGYADAQYSLGVMYEDGLGVGGFRREVQPRRQHWFLNEKSGFPFRTPAFCSVSRGQRRLGEKEYRAPSVTPGVALRPRTQGSAGSCPGREMVG